MSDEISAEQYVEMMNKTREATASSPSGIHYGHYKASAQSNNISSFLAKKITLISRTGILHERWSCGLTIMLEQIAGIALVNKLRVILLMEADFSMHNTILFCALMLNAARDSGIILSEKCSNKKVQRMTTL